MINPWDQINPPSEDVSARRIDHTHSLDLFWARDHIGHYLFIYEFVPEEKILEFDLPDLVGIQAVYIPANQNNNNSRLILMLKERSGWEIFLSLCNDLVQATRNVRSSSTAVQAILRRLSRWHEFLKKNRNDILSEEKIKGLIGELLFIRNHLIPAFGVGQSIVFWQGPEGLAQDFNVNNSAIEVKCQSGSSTPNVNITSAEQLCPQLAEMYLFVVTLGKTVPEHVDAINLPILIGEIREKLEQESATQSERFSDLLLMSGYGDSDRYLDFSYILAAEAMFQVTDDFPKICSDAIHSGIISLSYKISLSACEDFENKPAWMETLK